MMNAKIHMGWLIYSRIILEFIVGKQAIAKIISSTKLEFPQPLITVNIEPMAIV